MENRDIMSTSRRMFSEAWQLVSPKNNHRNFVSAAFHMVTISNISMSLVDLNWFILTAKECPENVVLSDFFTYGYLDDTMDINDVDYSCISNVINLLRITILLCFMAIIFSLVGFFLDILGTKTKVAKVVRKYSLASSCTVIIIMGIISTCYYIAVIIEDTLDRDYPKEITSVFYGFGFYLIAATGGIALLGTFCSLILTHAPTATNYPSDEGCLIDNDVDALDTFHSPPPPPPYNVAPPPYTP